MFYAAVLMKQESMFFGKGDFVRILDLLEQKYSDQYKDVANKLKMIKSGKIIDLSGTKQTLNSMADLYKEKDHKDYAIYSDKGLSFIRNSVNYKKVF